jgi:hypothetical protein
MIRYDWLSITAHFRGRSLYDTLFHCCCLSGWRSTVFLYLLSPSMIRAECRTKFCFMRLIIIVGVIGCLCFSVGEGLRLRPFPVSTLGESDATNPQHNASRETSLCNYGPLDLPTPLQSRGKRRQVLDYGNPPLQSSGDLIAHQILLSDTAEAVDIVFLLFTSPSTGRAPPFGC